MANFSGTRCGNAESVGLDEITTVVSRKTTLLGTDGESFPKLIPALLKWSNGCLVDV